MTDAMFIVLYLVVVVVVVIVLVVMLFFLIFVDLLCIISHFARPVIYVFLLFN